MLYNFWILVKLIKRLKIIVLVYVVICIIYLQNYFCVNFLKINYLNLVPAPIMEYRHLLYFFLQKTLLVLTEELK